MLYHSKHRSTVFPACLLRKPVSTGFCDKYINLNVIFTDPDYALLLPCPQDDIPPPLVEKIATCLATQFDAPMKDIQSHLLMASLRRFGKVQCLNGGDLINASTLVAFGDDR